MRKASKISVCSRCRAMSGGHFRRSGAFLTPRVNRIPTAHMRGGIADPALVVLDLFLDRTDRFVDLRGERPASRRNPAVVVVGWRRAHAFAGGSAVKNVLFDGHRPRSAVLRVRAAWSTWSPAVGRVETADPDDGRVGRDLVVTDAPVVPRLIRGPPASLACPGRQVQLHPACTAVVTPRDPTRSFRLADLTGHGQ